MASESGSAPGRRPTVTLVPLQPSAPERASAGQVAKPTVARLGVDLATLDWQRSGTGPGSFEVAFVAGDIRSQPEATGLSSAANRAGDAARSPAAEWVLLRVADDPVGRVLVFDRNEWLCFLDGAAHGEFDWRQGLARQMVV
jgi:hypothetical protein